MVDLKSGVKFSHYCEHNIDVVIGYIDKCTKIVQLSTLVDTIFFYENGSLYLLRGKFGTEDIFSLFSTCTRCGLGAEEPDTCLFFFNSHCGVCIKCNGTGNVAFMDETDIEEKIFAVSVLAVA